MLRKIFKTLIGILFLPLVASFSVAFYEQFGNIEASFSVGQRYFLWGIICYCFIQLLVFKPSYLYVLGHETVHALATWICLGKVTSFKVTSKGGSVSTSKSNFFISLSPYLIPIYVILMMLAYFFADNIFFNGNLSPSLFMFLLGFTLAFHIVMTVDTLKTQQPDLIKVGVLSSCILIYVVNLAIVAGALALLFKGFLFASFASRAFNLTGTIYYTIFKQLFL